MTVYPNKDIESFSAIEEGGQESISRLFSAAKRLVTQGTKLEHVHTGTKMILFVGRSGENIVDIQTQSGDKTKQLFVTTLGNNDAFMIRMNDQQSEHFSENVKAFNRGRIDSQLRQEIEQQFPRYINRIKFDLPVASGDLASMVEILERTTIDQDLMERTIEHDTYSGEYRRSEPIKKIGARRFFGLLGK